MNRFCFYPHPASTNHGCEAIAVSSYYILKKHNTEAQATLLTKYPKNSERRGGELAYNLYDKEINAPLPSIRRYSIEWVKYLTHKMLNKDMAVSILSKSAEKKYCDLIKANDIFVSIGGDNYCYGRPVPFYAMNKAIQESGKKSMLWGCSIEPSAITDEMVADLRLYNVIVTRESLTYNALREIGLRNIKLYPDPAFTLEPVFYKEIAKDTVGINISPMILDYAGEKSEKVYQAYRKMIEYILDKTKFNIALIPHVTSSTTDDRTILKQLFNDISSEERMTLYDDMDCQRIKSVISQCRFFIGARTHATIAAYSSCVPTLVCGYSVKAKGIATDLFGTYKNYVVPVQEIEDKNVLTEAFKWMVENEDDIREKLCEIMPEYIGRAWQAGEEFLNVAK